MKRLVTLLVAFCLAAIPVEAQLPPSGGIAINQTPVSGGTTNQCLYVTSTNKVGNQACGTGTAADIKVGTTTITSGTDTYVLFNNAGTLGNEATVPGINGGTGVANSGKTITLGGNLTTTGAFNTTFAIPGTGTWTFPVAGSSLAPLTAPVFVTSMTLPSVAYASIPAPGTAGKIVRVSDFGTKGSLLMDDGTRWKPMNGCTVLATTDSIVTTNGTANAQVIVLQYQLAANMLQNKDRLRFYGSITKSGTTDVGTIKVFAGTTGTSASDTQIVTSNVLAAANRSMGVFFDIRLESATSMQQIPNAASTNNVMSYSQVGNAAFGAAITGLTSFAANAIYITVTLLSNGTADTVSMQDGLLQLCATAN